MEEYIVNFLAAVDVRIEADSPEEATKKAMAMVENEYWDKQFEYAHLTEINFITTMDGTEV